MKVNINVDSYSISKKLETPKQSPKKEEFKKVLDNHENSSKKSTNENIDKASLKDLDEDTKKTTAEDNDVKSLNVDEKVNNLNVDEKVNNLKVKVLDFLEVVTQVLHQESEDTSKELAGHEKSPEEIAQIQELLQSLVLMFQGSNEVSQTKNKDAQGISLNLEQLLGFEKLTSSSKDIIKSNISEIVAMLEKHKGNNGMNLQIIEMLQKLNTEVSKVNGELDILKIPSVQVVNPNSEERPIKENILKDVIKQSSNVINQIASKGEMKSSSDAGKDNKSSGNNSPEEKFLSNLIGEDKDEIKISKVVNFMNQFETVKTIDSSKIQTPNVVIDKSNIGADVIKTIKFMEINNIKDLTVKMNPKELGEITIKIIVESGIMKASITAQNKDTYNLLNQNIQDISDKLKNMDIKIQSLDINIYEDSTFFSKNSNGRNDKNNNEGQSNNSKGNMSIEEDISIRNTYSIEENQVNKFV